MGGAYGVRDDNPCCHAAADRGRSLQLALYGSASSALLHRWEVGRVLLWHLRSYGEGKFGEGCWEPISRADIKAEFVVAAVPLACRLCSQN